MGALAKTVIFFCAAPFASVAETSQIEALSFRYKNVLVRDGVQAGVAFGSGNLEPADALAGTIPTSYKTAAGPSIDTDLYPDGDVTPGDEDAKLEGLLIFPATVSFSHTTTFQLYCAGMDVTNGVGTLSDKTSGSGIAWDTSDHSKATISSGGLITGVAAGSCTVTMTYTYDTAKTQTATRSVTLS